MGARPHWGLGARVVHAGFSRPHVICQRLSFFATLCNGVPELGQPDARRVRFLAGELGGVVATLSRASAPLEMRARLSSSSWRLSPSRWTRAWPSGIGPWAFSHLCLATVVQLLLSPVRGLRPGSLMTRIRRPLRFLPDGHGADRDFLVVALALLDSGPPFRLPGRPSCLLASVMQFQPSNLSSLLEAAGVRAGLVVGRESVRPAVFAPSRSLCSGCQPKRCPESAVQISL